MMRWDGPSGYLGRGTATFACVPAMFARPRVHRFEQREERATLVRERVQRAAGVRLGLA